MKVLAAAGMVAGVFLLSSSGHVSGSRQVADAQKGPAAAKLSIYGQTLWNLEALLHDTYGKKTVCLRLRDDAFVSATCGDLAHYGYWKNIFVGASHSRFRLVHRSRPPALGNVVPITVKGLYVSCGNFPVAFASLAGPGNRNHRWLVLLHGWAMLPFTCL